MNARDLVRFTAALALGAAIAFPIGMWVAASSDDKAPNAPVPEDATGRRQLFSPVVTRDPHFMAEQRKNAAALEAACRSNGQFCAEAQAARGWLAEHGGSATGN